MLVSSNSLEAVDESPYLLQVHGKTRVLRPRCGASRLAGHDGYQRAFVFITGTARFGQIGREISNALGDGCSNS